MYKNPLSKLVTLTRRAGANKNPQTAVIVTVDCLSFFFQYVDIYHISIYHYLNVHIYIYIIGHIWYICNWLRSTIVQAGCMFACNCTPTVVTRIYWVRVKECHYLVSFHSVLPSLECTLPALNRNNCFPSDDFLDSNDCLIRGWWLECLQFHLVCQGMRVFVIFF